MQELKLKPKVQCCGPFCHFVLMFFDILWMTMLPHSETILPLECKVVYPMRYRAKSLTVPFCSASPYKINEPFFLTNCSLHTKKSFQLTWNAKASRYFELKNNWWFLLDFLLHKTAQYTVSPEIRQQNCCPNSKVATITNPSVYLLYLWLSIIHQRLM